MPDYSIRNIETVATPVLIYYTDVIRSNIELAINIAGGAERIRSHVKSHKTVGVPKIQAEYGIRKFKTATIAETEMMAAAGFDDLFMAYSLVGPNIGRFIALCVKYPETGFIGLTDNLTCAAQLSAEAARHGVRLKMMLDIDSGLHRSGVCFDTAEKLYPQIAALPHIDLLGVHVYDGENKYPDINKRLKETDRVYSQVTALREKMEKAGYPFRKVVLGGTPGFPCYARYPDVEVSPGTCFLQDASYQQKYADLPFTPAAILATRVISITGPDTVTFDLGYKSVASDPFMENRLCFVADWNAKIILQNEEHLVVSVQDGKMPKVGDVFYAIPGHVCPTSALYEKIAVVDEKRIVETWFPVASRLRTITI